MIVGLCGFAQSGKDTVGSILSEDFGYERRAFADALKSLAYDSSHYIADAVDRLGWDGAKEMPGIREYLQNLGVGARKNLYEDVWVDTVLPPWNKAHLRSSIWPPERDIVITDVRFNNEIDRIKAYCGKVGLVYRPGVEPPNDHISEVEWTHRITDFDFIIWNDMSIAHLKAEVDGLHRVSWRSFSDQQTLREKRDSILRLAT